MTRFDHIKIDAASGFLTVGVGALWGNILALVEPLGLVPSVMVTTRRAKVGGTLSANSLSRFSCLHGREGWHVRSLRVMTADGQVLTCSREVEPLRRGAAPELNQGQPFPQGVGRR